MGLRKAALWITAAMLAGTGAQAQRLADPDFKTAVERPAYTETHPTIVIDEAHSNFHTAEGRYKPLADLLRSDGYRVVPGTKRFSKESLEGVDILIISNATAPDATDDASGPAFTEQECDAVRDWVRAGGSLLLIADHTPYGSAAENLARRFNVDMGKGTVFDFRNAEGPNPTFMVFSRETGLLGSHPVLQGRNPSEEVKRVLAFAGQSLGAPDGAVALMKLSPTAYEASTSKELQAAIRMDARGNTTEDAEAVKAHSRPAGGRAQGVALEFGKGRVVVVGEAAMFTAQLIRFEQDGKTQEIRMGMNVSGNDDRQFVLNVMHWLSGLLR